MGSYKDYVERFELKYLITEAQADEVRMGILPYCEADRYNGPKQTGYSITSLYLDTPALAFHRAKMRDDPDRFKLRIRTYSEDGDAHLEIKRKVNKVVFKQRASVSRADVVDAVAGLAQPLRDGAAEHLEDFSRLSAVTGAAPVALIKYRREAYQSDVDSYARVTFDRRLCYQPAADFELTGDPDAWQDIDGYWAHDGVQSPVVLELKCETRVPWWLSSLIQTRALKLVGFSKYSQSILAEQRQERGLLPQSYG